MVAGKWKSKIDIAIKMMIEGSVNVDDFIEEATVMKYKSTAHYNTCVHCMNYIPRVWRIIVYGLY